jgi:hypothetical protein
MIALRRLAASLVVLACEPAPPKEVARAPAPAQEPAPPVVTPTPAPAQEPAPAPVRDANEVILDRLYGPRPTEPPSEELRGVFTIARVVSYGGGDPRYQPSTLHLDDGTYLFLAHHPLPGYLAFVDRRVVVAGWPAGAQYFRVATMSLAPGEVAREGVIDRLPPPPRVRSGAELRRHLGRWVLAVGTVERIEYAGKGHTDLVLRLADGGRVVAGAPYELYDRRGRVTVLGRVWRSGDGLRLGDIRVCAGEVESCGD